MTTRIDVDEVLADRRLLAHPFYRRWEAGALGEGELASYAAQYAHVERQLPRTLASLAAAAGPGSTCDAVAANLADELGCPRSHVELLGQFADAVGATDADATPATAALVALYDGATARSVDFALGVVAAYEAQAAEVASTKAEGLRAHYGVGPQGREFWDVHATMELDHADWTLGAAALGDREEVLAGMAASRDAWWGFLDEREAAAA